MGAAVAGRALMAAGARIGGATMARSAGGQALKTGAIQVFKSGAGRKVAGDIALLATGIKKSNSTLGKIFGKIKDSSPALQQQMLILKKGISLPLRAIGDIMARLIRPWARIGMRLGLELYKIISALGGAAGLGKKFSTESLNDRLKQLQTELVSAQLGGDAAMEALIQAQIDAINTKLGSSSADDKSLDLSSFVGSFWDDLFNALNLNLGGLTDLSSITDALDDVKDAINDKLDAVIDAVTETWDNFKGFIDDGLNWAQDIWDTYIAPWFDPLVGWASDIWTLYIKPWWDAATNWATKIWDDYIKVWWDGAKDWAQTIFDDYLAPGFEIILEALKAFAQWVVKKIPGGGIIEDAVNLGKDLVDASVEGGKKHKETGSFWEGIKAAVGDLFNGNSITGSTAGRHSAGDIEAFLNQSKLGRDVDTGQLNMSAIANSKIASSIYKEYLQNQSRFDNPLQASGGEINTTGMYGLHAGERVIPAGENNRSGGSVVNFQSKIIIQNPQMRNNTDIRALARQLAKHQERELRRRVSYV